MACNPTYMTSVYTAPSDLSSLAGVQVFVGSWASAVTEDDLTSCAIQSVLNVAYDLDDQPSSSGTSKTAPDARRPWQAAHASADSRSASRYTQQYAKVGLIDGVGNAEMTLLAAVYMADQLVTFPPVTPDPALQNQYSGGNILIHCYAGQSRSVTVAALYIYYKFGLCLGDPNVSDFATTYAKVAEARGDAAPTTPPSTSPPTTGMQDMAASIVSQYYELFPSPVLASPS